MYIVLLYLINRLNSSNWVSGKIKIGIRRYTIFLLQHMISYTLANIEMILDFKVPTFDKQFRDKFYE